MGSLVCGCAVVGMQRILFCVCLVHEILIENQLHATVWVFNDGGEAFDPITGVEVVDIADLFVFRGYGCGRR